MDAFVAVSPEMFGARMIGLPRDGSIRWATVRSACGMDGITAVDALTNGNAAHGLDPADGQPPRFREGWSDDKPTPTACAKGGGDFHTDMAAQGRIDRLEQKGGVRESRHGVGRCPCRLPDVRGTAVGVDRNDGSMFLAVGISLDHGRMAFCEKGRRAVGCTGQVVGDYPDEERCVLLHVGEHSRTVKN